MDITHKDQKIVFLFAEYRLVAVLEEVAAAARASVEILGILGQKLSHDG